MKGKARRDYPGEVVGTAERDVEVVTVQRVQCGRQAAAHAQLRDELGKLGRESADDPQWRMHLAPNVDSERARVWPEFGGSFVGRDEKPARVWKEFATGGGKVHQIALPLEQAIPHHLLEPLYPFRQALLTDEQPRGGAPEVQLFGRDNERSDL